MAIFRSRFGHGAESRGEGSGRRTWRRLLLMALLAVAMPACDPGPKPSPRGGAASPTTTPRKVQTARVAERRIERSIFALGSLLAHEQATLSAKVAGRIQTLQVDLGSQVRQGDVLAQIESREYQFKLQQAAAALSQARALLGLPLEGEDDRIEAEKASTVKEALAVLDEAKANLDRITRLAREKIISQSEVDTAQSAYLVALNRCQDAREKVRQQQAMVMQRRAEYEIAKQQLVETTIVAPFDGGIQERRTNVGEYMTVGSPVATLVRMDPLRLRVEVSERDAPKVRLGQVVRFLVEGDTNMQTGKLDRLSPALVEHSRMLVVEADIRNDGRLHPGYYARAEIVTSPDTLALTIPTNAVVVFAGLEKVFTLQAGKAVEKRLRTGDSGPDWVEVVSGLTAGEEVVLNPGSLQSGIPVMADSSPH